MLHSNKCDGGSPSLEILTGLCHVCCLSFAVGAIQRSRQHAVRRIQCLHTGGGERGRPCKLSTMRDSKNQTSWCVWDLNTRHRLYLSARSGWSDARLPELANGREPNAPHDAWDLHTPLPVTRPGHKTTIPTARHQTQH